MGTVTSEAGFERARELHLRARSRGLDLACLLVAVDRVRRFDPETLRLVREAVEALVLSQPEGGAWRVLRAGDELLVLCPGLGPAEAGTAARGLVDGARALRVRSGARELRPRLSIGLAHTRGRGELELEVLFEVARESLGVAQAAGGDRWVHTELYDLLVRRRRNRKLEEEAALCLEELAEGFLPPEPEPVVESCPSSLQGSAAGEPSCASTASGSTATPAPGPQAVEADPWSPLGTGFGALADEFERGQGGSLAPAAPRRVEVLERRIVKLLRALELAEGEVLRLQREFGSEAGIASIYRTVQGLAPDAPLLETKRRLMRELYRANEALRRAAS